jgi:hypothetical protein
VATDFEELAYDLSMRALSQQENLLTEVRERTGLLLAATAVATSLLGGRALDDGERTVIDLVAIALALLSLVLSVYVLAPKRDLTFAIDGPAVYEYFADEQTGLSDARLDLAYWNREAWEANQVIIDGLIRFFKWACYALVGAVVLWSVGLAIQ